MITEEQAHAVVKRLTADREPVVLRLSKFDAFALILAIQLVNRHPHCAHSLTLKRAVSIAHKMQEFAADDPELMGFLQMGWDKQNDVPLEGGGA